jgi:hypothetical protein
MSCRGKLFLTLVTLATFLAAANAALANDSVSILYSFNGASGSLPRGMIQDSAGNFYGTAQSGGSPPCSCGAVFELSPSPPASGCPRPCTASLRCKPRRVLIP